MRKATVSILAVVFFQPLTIARSLFRSLLRLWPVTYGLLPFPRRSRFRPFTRFLRVLRASVVTTFLFFLTVACGLLPVLRRSCFHPSTRFLRVLRASVVTTFLFFLTVACCLWPVAYAQSESATLSGVVTDPKGGAIVDAEVVLTNTDTQVEQRTKTNSSGLYVFTGVHPGNYRVAAGSTGFKTLIKENLTLHIQEEVSENFSLPLGSVAETVTVQAGGININSTDGTVSTLVDQSYVANMPLNGRSFQDLLLLAPGVVTNTPQVGNRALSGGPAEQSGLSVNGQRIDANYFTVDGVSANSATTGGVATLYGGTASGSFGASTTAGLGTTQALVSVDALQEFNVQTSSSAAQYGRSPGGQFALSTKSGTNTYHGTVFDYYRDDSAFGATDYFNNFRSLGQPPLRQQDFGGTLGGPVRIPGVYNGKDKTFFFVSYEGLRLVEPSSNTTYYVPDLCVRGIAGACTAADTANGIFPSTNPTMLAVLRAFPYPNFQADLTSIEAQNPGVGVGLAAAAASFPLYINAPSVRLDQVINSKMTIFFRFANTTSGSTNDTFGNAGANTSLTRTFTGGADNTLSSRLSNQFRLNYTLSTAKVLNTYGNYAFTDAVPASTSPCIAGTTGEDCGIGGTSVPLSTSFSALLGLPSNVYPILQLYLNSPDPVQSSSIATINQQNQWNPVDTLSYSAGAHQLKFGVDYRRIADTIMPPSSVVYQLDPTAITTGILDTDPNANPPGGSAVAPSIAAPNYPVYTNFSAFAQDTWKLSPRLTLDFGLRWELNPAPGVSQGNLPFTVTGNGFGVDNTGAPTGFQLLCANGVNEYLSTSTNPCLSGAPLWRTTWFNFAPRLGAAYQLRTNPGWQTVLRGGFGVYYDTGQQDGSVGFAGPGFSSAPTAVNFLSNCTFPGFTINNNGANCPAGTSPSLYALPPIQTSVYSDTTNPLLNANDSLYGFDPHLQLPYTLQWNASLQQQLGRSQSLTISYVGSHGSRLLEELEFENSGSYPNGTNVFLVKNGNTSDYNALQLQFQRRLSHGLTVLSSYTWSHCIDYGSSNFQIGYQRGNCDTDVRQQFSTAFSYSVPKVSDNGIVNTILSHWGVDDYFLARTAFPIYLAGNPVLNGTTGQLEPSSYGTVIGQPLYLYGSTCTSFFQSIHVLLADESCPGGRAINPCAFYQITTNGAMPNFHCTLPAANIGGVAPRNQLRGFGAWQMNLAIRREFPIYERLKLQFRAEAFNVFNHPNFGIFQTVGRQFGLVTNSLAGSMGSVGGGESQQYQLGGPRSMQFALKLIF